MPKKPRKSHQNINPSDVNAHILNAGKIVDEQIEYTLEKNYMPYAMSVIMSRAIPEIDGFKPSHRKLLYTMYDMGLMTGPRTKSANIVGRTMQLNPHGDGPIYDTLVRLSRGYSALLYPYIDSKGNFGKHYSRDMAYAASRYTEAKLEPIAAELFRDIDKDTIDFVDNYDATKKEPTLLPVTYPSVLVNANTGIAVGMASSIASFNLEEVCRTTIALMADEQADIFETLKAPDFANGGMILYDKATLESIYNTGRGSLRVRSVYEFDKANNCIDIFEIPFTTTIEAIKDKVVELFKIKKLPEISDIRDETGLKGLKITIDLKRGTDPDKLMNKLFKMTTLEDSISCNFNVLINKNPMVIGVRELLLKWIDFRVGCVKRRVAFDLKKAEAKLHLLKGLAKILLDIDKAIKIVRETELENMVVANLMIGFGIDEIQAEYVAEIKLRHLNREYILRRTSEIEKLEADIKNMQDTLASNRKIRTIIKNELENVIKKYGEERKTKILYDFETFDGPITEEVAEYPVHLFYTKQGYFKKITTQSLRSSGAQKLKDDDEIALEIDGNNKDELLFFSDKQQVYKSRAADFEDTKASNLGDFIPSALEFENGEHPLAMVKIKKYAGYLIFVFENGKVAKVDINAYQTVTKRKKLINAYSDKSPLVAVFYFENGDAEIVMQASNGKVLLVHTGAINIKTTKNTQGVQAMTIRKGHRVQSAAIFSEGDIAKPHRHRSRNLPAAGQRIEIETEQMSF